MRIVKRVLARLVRSSVAAPLTGAGETGWLPGERARLLGFAGVMVAVTLVPVRQNWRPRERRVDGFPLSYYPMFSKRRRTGAKIAYAVGVRADGSRRFLPREVLGDGGHNQVRHQLHRAAVREKRAQDCLAVVLSRLPGRPELADLVRVEIVRGEFDLDACMLTRRVEGVETVLAGADLAPTGIGGARTAATAGTEPITAQREGTVRAQAS